MAKQNVCIQPIMNPKAKGPIMQTASYNYNVCKMIKPAAMNIVLVVIICNLFVIDTVTKKIQKNLDIELAIQKYIL